MVKAFLILGQSPAPTCPALPSLALSCPVLSFPVQQYQTLMLFLHQLAAMFPNVLLY